MKKRTLILAFLAMSITLLAQPTNITWQGKLLDADGNAITQNNVAMTFAIYNASTGGNQLWPASGAVVKYVNVLNGLYSVQLGTGFDDDIAFTAAMFDGKTPWLEVKVGTETLPRTPVTNVPFALISNELSASGWENPGEIGKITPTTGTFTSVETGNIKVTNGAAEGKVLTSDAEGNASWETSQGQTPGTEPGEMQYWNGTAWVTVAAGNEGQVLTFTGGVPAWTNQTAQPEEGEVQNPITGRIWMDKNLGASQVATSSTDADAYGDLYQWGRLADGHQIRTSSTTFELSSSNTPGHDLFIIIGLDNEVNPTYPHDWRDPQYDNLWQGVLGLNNPCPNGYSIPTEAEWEAERQSWSENSADGAFASTLKLPLAGLRSAEFGVVYFEGEYGDYWSSTVGVAYAKRLRFDIDDASMGLAQRARGLSVRCIKY